MHLLSKINVHMVPQCQRPCKQIIPAEIYLLASGGAVRHCSQDSVHADLQDIPHKNQISSLALGVLVNHSASTNSM